jgi:hypothetical protein
MGIEESLVQCLTARCCAVHDRFDIGLPWACPLSADFRLGVCV